MNEAELMAHAPLDEASLLAAAREQAGLEDFGDETFLPALRVLLEGLENEAKLHAGGRYGQYMRILGLLVNRLRLQADLVAHPEIRDEQIMPAIAIVGLPRTGSTMLHRLLASDPEHRGMLWWEGRYPARFPGEERGSGYAARINAAHMEIEAMVAAAPDLMKIHPMDHLAADEEILLLEHNLFSTVPPAFVYLPGYNAWVEEQDHHWAYQDLKLWLQYLQWQRPDQKAKTWVLKTPHHLGFVDVLLEVFPGTKVIQTHRDPLETVPSFCSMIKAGYGPSSDQVVDTEIGDLWGNKLARVLRHCLKIHDRHPEQFFDSDYRKVLQDPVAQARRIYEWLGKDFSNRAEAAMEAWVVENEQHKHGAHEYRLEDYGLTREGILKDFSEYRSRFIE